VLLLDTHVWVWHVRGDQRGIAFRESIDQAGEVGDLALSAISVWEVAMLAAKGRLHLDGGCLEWARDAMSRSRAVLTPLSPEVAVESTHLPGDFHSDPADQIIVATARIHNATLVTRDAGILAYAQKGFVKVLAV
jgi:PIN domain nuclease of toxin-antitoxin system